MNLHLTDDEIDDHLIGEATPATEAHLESCLECQARAAQFTGALGDFNQASLSWAEAKSNGISRDLRDIRPAMTSSRRSLPALSAGLAVVLAVTVLGMRHRPAPVLPAGQITISVESPNPNSAVAIAGDNALLAQIDAALDDSDTPLPVSLRQGSRPHRAHTLESAGKDNHAAN